MKEATKFVPPRKSACAKKDYSRGVIIERTHLQKEENNDRWSMLEDETEYFWNVHRRYPDGSAESFRLPENEN